MIYTLLSILTWNLEEWSLLKENARLHRGQEGRPYFKTHSTIGFSGATFGTEGSILSDDAFCGKSGEQPILVSLVFQNVGLSFLRLVPVPFLFASFFKGTQKDNNTFGGPQKRQNHVQRQLRLCSQVCAGSTI